MRVAISIHPDRVLSIRACPVLHHSDSLPFFFLSFFLSFSFPHSLTARQDTDDSSSIHRSSSSSRRRKLLLAPIPLVLACVFELKARPSLDGDGKEEEEDKDKQAPLAVLKSLRKIQKHVQDPLTH